MSEMDVSEEPQTETIARDDHNEIYKFLAHHGISQKTRDLFSSSTLNGQFFKEFLETNIDAIKILNEYDFKILKDIDIENLKNNHINVLEKYDIGIEILEKNYIKILKEKIIHLLESLINDFEITLMKDEAKHLLAIIKKYQNNNKKMNHKTFGDNIHGQIQIHPLLVRIIDTPQFQRLRHIKQLEAVSYVYPSANHTRFEHCIGTSYICDFFMKHLKENQPELKITLQDELCVRIAALCSDLGRAPFSHILNGIFDWWHTKSISIFYFDEMLKENVYLKEDFESYGLFENDLQLIKDLIYNEKFDSNKTYEEKLKSLDSWKRWNLEKKGFDKSFLFEIVSNNRNGIDAIKFDYLKRDSQNLALKINFDYVKCIKNSRVIKDRQGFTQICYQDKIFKDVYKIYHDLKNLTEDAYKHKKCVGIYAMIYEAFKLASDHFKFAEMNKCTDNYKKLNDSIYLKILNSENDELKLSRDILKRVEKRKLYKYLGEWGPTENFDIQSFLLYKSNDFHVEHVKFNWGSNSPLKNVNFYNEDKPDEIKQIQGDDVPDLSPKEYLYFYLPKEDFDTDFFKETNKAVKDYCEKKGLEGLKLMHDVD